jgi:hypothetical protein
VQSDGDYRLSLPLLVEVSEEAASRKAEKQRPPDAADALNLLSVRQRSACSACSEEAPVSVERIHTQPVSVPSESVSVRAGQPLPNAAEQSEHDGCLKNHHAWRALQTADFRPTLQLGKLRACFYAAVEAGLFDAAPDEKAREDKQRFLATAWDLAHSGGVKSPAVCLRVRVEKQACWRVSPEGVRWAKQWIFPEYAREPRKTEAVEY